MLGAGALSLRGTGVTESVLRLCIAIIAFFFMAVIDNFYGFYGLAFEKCVGNWLGAL